MSAFWPENGIRRQVPRIVGGELLDAEVSDLGIRFFIRGTSRLVKIVHWKEVFGEEVNNGDRAEQTADRQ